MNDRAHDELRELLPDYILGALPLAAADQVGQHLALCPDCQRTIETLIEALALVGPPETPRPEVQVALFARIREGAPHGAVAVLPAPPRQPRPTVLPPAPQTAPITIPAPRQPTPLRPHRPVIWQIALVATLALLLGASGVWNVVQQRQLASRGQIDRLLANPQAAHALTDTDLQTGAAGTLYAEPTGTVALLVVNHLPPLPSDQRYQLWLFTEAGTRESAGLFTVNADGVGQLVVEAPQAFSNYWAVAISAEPVAGSAAPTSALTLGGWIR